jgi:hypothetical protein
MLEKYSLTKVEHNSLQIACAIFIHADIYLLHYICCEKNYVAKHGYLASSNNMQVKSSEHS